METVKVSPEIYEAVKAQVLAELKEEQRARQRESKRICLEASRMFKELEIEYIPKIVTKLSKNPSFVVGNDLYIHACRYFNRITELALSMAGAYNQLRAYKEGKAEEVKNIARKLLEEQYGK